MINTMKNMKAFKRATGRDLNPRPIFVDKTNDHGGVAISHVSMPAMSLEAMDALSTPARKAKRASTPARKARKKSL